MAFSAIQIIEQQANAYFDNFANTLDDLQRLYNETGDVQALECRNRLLARYQSKPYWGDPASDNNGKSEGRVFMRGDPESSPKAKRGRKSHAGEKVTKAFKYNVRDVRVANKRLTMLYNALLAFGWIREDTQQQTFIDLFSGGDCSHRIVWMDDVNTLADLFRRLVSVEGLVAVQSPYGLWQMVDGHFWEKEGNKAFGNQRLRKTHTPQEKSRHINYLVNILNPRYTEQQLMEMLMGEIPEEDGESA